MKRNRLRSLGVTVTCIAVLGSVLPAAASAGIVGAGSTLMTPLMARWTADFGSRYGVGVTYGSVGSGAGIAQITARTVDFGASDAPLTSAQAAACNHCVMIPWALTATGIAFNLPGVKTLKLSVKNLADIYLGKITNWSAPQIKKDNKGVALPNLKITPVYRSDGSGDTYAFTDLLSQADKEWGSRVGHATSVNFPTGVGGKGNDGVTAQVSSTSGSLGYIAASYIIAHHLSAAALQNRAGKYEYPNLANIAAAAAAVKHVGANNEVHIVWPPKSAKTAYPLSTYSYAIVPQVVKQRAAVASFANYAISPTGQAMGSTLDFAPIPSQVYRADVAALATLQQG